MEGRRDETRESVTGWTEQTRQDRGRDRDRTGQGTDRALPNPTRVQYFCQMNSSAKKASLPNNSVVTSSLSRFLPSPFSQFLER